MNASDSMAMAGLIIADDAPEPARMPADFKHAKPPPGVSSLLVAVCTLGCIAAIGLAARGSVLVFVAEVLGR